MRPLRADVVDVDGGAPAVRVAAAVTVTRERDGADLGPATIERDLLVGPAPDPTGALERCAPREASAALQQRSPLGK